MGVLINPPPSNLGNAQIYSYLYHLSEQMNYALQNIDSGSVKQDSKGNQSVVYTSSDGSVSSLDMDSYNELRTLIIKTGEAVSDCQMSISLTDSQIRSELLETGGMIANLEESIGQLNAELTNIYSSTSDFGSYIEAIKSNLKLDATGQETNYTIIQALKDVSDNISGIHEWMIKSENFIKIGYIREKDGRPEIGIAIGDLGEVTTVTDKDGNQMIRANTDKLLSFYTADKISFLRNQIELAYLGGDAGLGVDKAKITGALTFGGYQFSPQEDNGMILQWVGVQNGN